MNIPARQRGVALIVVLLVFAILYTIAIEVMYRQDRFRARTQNMLEWDQRYQAALAVETIAVRGLQDDLEQDLEDGARIDDCVEDQWAVRLPPTPYEGVVLSATVQDLQGRFNLNQVTRFEGNEFVQHEPGRRRLARLLAQTLEDPGSAERLSWEMADWIDSNTIVDGVEGAEDAEYRYRRTPNIPVAHESELRALLSMEPDSVAPGAVFWGLFTALPLDFPLNLNTAPVPVLQAVLGDAEAAAMVAELRAEEAIDSVEALMDEGLLGGLEDDEREQLAAELGVSSNFFQVMVDVEQDGRRTRLVTRLYRSDDGGTRVFSRELVPVMAPLEPPCNPLYNGDSD